MLSKRLHLRDSSPSVHLFAELCDKVCQLHHCQDPPQGTSKCSAEDLRPLLCSRGFPPVISEMTKICPISIHLACNAEKFNKNCNAI